jgi:hypothetical protein
MAWKHTVEIRQFITADDSPAASKAAATAIASKLKSALSYTDVDTWELQNIIDNLNDSENCGDVNAALDDLYDWGDQNRVWFGIK